MFVTFRSDNHLSVTVLLGDAAPVLSGGYGGWEAVDRPKRVSMVRYKGRQPFNQDIQILFDGWANDEIQEDEITKLELMATSPSDLREPPKVTISGPVLKQELTWVITSIDWDSQLVIWSDDGRLRQAATVHLMQFVDDNVLTTAASPAIRNNPDTNKKHKITTPHGMTLKQIAMLVYKDPDLYVLILDANPFLNPDPRAIIPTGTPLFIPTANGFIAKTIIVQ